ncbi:hypothetical protein BB559_004260 [Furculomyces boomerangus]|uniref:CN hydrolase domain-containing protein n=2 Tax=Harpellales TaxID=61421 RepID=A0A2T9YFP2_9FUNG|nr:hypothetical protein BB559_004260 [Furculomyces boomerangus]PWA01753.1 hypothetical protein BB558_002131 [Smittium angustum]
MARPVISLKANKVEIFKKKRIDQLPLVFISVLVFKRKNLNMTIENMGRKAIASVAQYFGTNVMEENLQMWLSLVKEAVERVADYNELDQEKCISMTESLENNFVKTLRNTAKENNIWISIVTTYRKLFMFEGYISGGTNTFEGDRITLWPSITEPIDSPVGKLGLAICHDVRYPELAFVLSAMGAQGIGYSSACLEKTESAQWEVLMRERAIETQTYVYASNQIGYHRPGIEYYRDVMVVDSWETITARCSKSNVPMTATAEIDLGFFDTIRKKLPVYNLKRLNIFKSTWQ